MIAAWAKNYIGIPFVSGGRTRDGVDCYGLVRLVWKEQFEYELPLLSNQYENALATNQTNPLVNKYKPLLVGTRKKVPELGNLVVILNGGLPTHLAIYAGDNYILHTVKKVGTVLQRLSDYDLKNRIEGYYGIKTKNSDSSVFRKI